MSHLKLNCHDACDCAFRNLQNLIYILELSSDILHSTLKIDNFLLTKNILRLRDELFRMQARTFFSIRLNFQFL